MEDRNYASFDWYQLVCSSKALIGPNINSIKCCRFCKKPYSPQAFSQRTHIVSESLGNRGMISTDECNDCNNLFSRIEQDFFIANKYFLILDNIIGKNGNSPCFDQGNFKFYNSGEHLVIQVPSSEKKPILRSIKNGQLLIERMGNNDKFRPINVYKSLVKYALSILPSEKLIFFNNTVEWIRENDNHNAKICLPPVFHTVVSPTKFPVIKTFIHTSSDVKIPFAWGVFQCASIKYFFIIPFTHEWFYDNSDLEYLKNFLFLIYNNENPPNLTQDDMNSYDLYRVKFGTDIKIE